MKTKRRTDPLPAHPFFDRHYHAGQIPLPGLDMRPRLPEPDLFHGARLAFYRSTPTVSQSHAVMVKRQKR